jgi:hypothetical protein
MSDTDMAQMDGDTAQAAWFQHEQEGRQFEEQWQAIRAACHREWKAQIEAMSSQRKEMNSYELECF